MTLMALQRSGGARQRVNESVRALARVEFAAAVVLVLLACFALGIALFLYRGSQLGLPLVGAPLLFCMALIFTQHLRGAVVGWLVLSPLLYPLVNYPPGHALLTFDRLWLLPLALTLLISRSAREPTRLGLLGKSALAFVVLFGIRAIFSGPQVQSSLSIWLDAIVLPVALFLVIRRLATTSANRLRLAGAMAWAGTLVAVIGVTERLFGYELASRTGGEPRIDSGLPGVVRVSGPYSVPEVYSLVLVATLAATLYWWQSVHRRGGLVLIAVLLQVAGLANSLFRVSWISTVVVLVVALGFRPRQRLRAVTTLGVAGVLAGIALLPLASSPLFTERATDTGNVLGRFATYLQAIEIFKTSPIVGVGIGSYNTVAVDFRGVYVDGIRSVDFAHSSFFNVLAEQGVVGFVPLIAVTIGLALFARRLWRTGGTPEHDALAAAIWAALIGYMAFSLTLTMITYGDSNAYLAALLGLGAGVLTERAAAKECSEPQQLPESAPSARRLISQRG